MLVEIDREVWIADGPTVPFLGVFPYPTRMAIVRLRNGDLWVWSPIALDDALAARVDALGRVRHLVSPNKIHHLFLADWSRRWPQASLWASPGLARRRPDLSFAGELDDAPEPAWAGEIDQVVFRGSFAMEEVVFFHAASRTAFFCDLIQKFDPASLSGWRAWFMRLDGLVGAGGSTPREWRLSFTRRREARRALARALAWNPQRLVIAHGVWVREHGAENLARSLAWLAAR
jgi:hypothetical protein